MNSPWPESARGADRRGPAKTAERSPTSAGNSGASSCRRTARTPCRPNRKRTSRSCVYQRTWGRSVASLGSLPKYSSRYSPSGLIDCRSKQLLVKPPPGAPTPTWWRDTYIGSMVGAAEDRTRTSFGDRILKDLPRGGASRLRTPLQGPRNLDTPFAVADAGVRRAVGHVRQQERPQGRGQQRPTSSRDACRRRIR